MKQWYTTYLTEVNSAIEVLFHERYSAILGSEAKFEAAMKHAVEGGGKRIRPILAILAYEYVMRLHGKTPDHTTIMETVLGLECIHCYTLVHDDMPCMDNDELRRGKPTVWKAYGETLATLVGDALQTLGFELVAGSGDAAIVREVAKTLGDLGVVRGQVRDTLDVQNTLSFDELMRLHDEKTGGFIALSLVVGAMLAHADASEVARFREMGILLGRGFQFRDDILDHEGSALQMGKNVGKDVALGKGIVALIGIERARDLLNDIKKQTLALVPEEDPHRIKDIVTYIFERDR